MLTNADNCSNRNLCQQSTSVNESSIYSGYSDILPKSPISPRVKNIDRDMEALTLSRQDNPYIMQQLERLSVTNEYLTELSISTHSSPARSVQRISISTNDQHITSDGNFIMDCEDFDDNLHDKLIRSPPPNFPQKLSLFVFPDSSAGSVQSYSLTKSRDNSEYSPTRSLMSPTFILSNQRLKDKSLVSKSRISNMSNEKDFDDMKTHNVKTHLRQNLNVNPSNYSKYERRGSDSSIVSNNWKTCFYNPSMAASSSSLLSYIPRYPAINSCNLESNESNMSSSEYNDHKEEEEEQISQYKTDSLAVMDIYCDYSDDSSNQMSFISPSNSREALIKDITQVT
jgi:hypothetical protein